MIRRYLIQWVFSLVVVTLAMHQAFAQVNLGARPAALGMATTALYENNWGIFSNPASIYSESLEVGFYSFQNYGFPELTDVSARLVYPLFNGHSAVGFYRFGNDLYAETNINIAYKYSAKNIHAGISTEYRHLSLGDEYGSGGALSFTLGVISYVSENFTIGAKLRNINRAAYQFEYNDETLPQDISAGFSYKLENQALFLFDVIKDVRFPLSYRAGIEIEIIDSLIGRIGTTIEPVIYTFGLGYSTKNWLINLAVQQHEILGTSPGADLIIRL